MTKAVERDLYGSRNMFAEIGGFVGIFLGSSLMDLVDALMTVLQQSVGRSKWKNKAKGNRQDIPVVKDKE